MRLRDGRDVAVERAEFRVTRDRTTGQGEVVLAMARLKCSGPIAPPVVFLAGGPGDSGVRWAEHPPFYEAFDRVRQVADVILLDQRGSGDSQPNLTVPAPELEGDALANRANLFEAFRRQAEAWQPKFPGLEAINPVESADDLGDLSTALGGQIILWGYSYGTHLAQAACKRHPDKLARVVLCGFEGPDHTLKLPANIQAQVERLGLDAELMRRIHDRLAEPLKVGPYIVGAFALQHLVSTWLGVSNRYGLIAPLYEALERGDTGPLEKGLTGWAKSLRRSAAFYSTDGASGVSPERLALIRAQACACVLGDAINFPFPEIAASWGARDLGDEFRTPLATRLPILILTGSMDGNTPTNQALEGMTPLPNARHLLVEGAAHNDMIAGAPAVEAIARFIGEGAWPEVESVPLRPTG